MEEKHKLLMSSGGPKLPIGYRFHPTDEELVVHYLKRKVFSIPLPAFVIPDFDVFQTDPWALPGEMKEKRYFFHKQRRDINIMSKRIEAGSGYWKPIGKERLIVTSEFNNMNQPVGIRKTMVFCGKNRPDNRHRWLMHEFHLVRPGPTPNSVQLISPMEMKEYWVVCGVFQKKRRSMKKNGVVSHPTTANNKRKQFMIAEVNRPNCSVGPLSPFSSSSGITEVSSLINGNIDDDDDQEESSSKINITHSHGNIQV